MNHAFVEDLEVSVAPIGPSDTSVGGPCMAMIFILIMYR